MKARCSVKRVFPYYCRINHLVERILAKEAEGNLMNLANDVPRSALYSEDSGIPRSPMDPNLLFINSKKRSAQPRFYFLSATSNFFSIFFTPLPISTHTTVLFFLAESLLRIERVASLLGPILFSFCSGTWKIGIIFWSMVGTVWRRIYLGNNGLILQCYAFHIWIGRSARTRFSPASACTYKFILLGSNEVYTLKNDVDFSATQRNFFYPITGTKYLLLQQGCLK